MKKYLRRSVRAFVYAAAIHIVFIYFILPYIALYLNKVSRGGPLTNLDIDQYYFTKMFFYVFFSPFMYIWWRSFNVPPSFKLDYIAKLIQKVCGTVLIQMGSKTIKGYSLRVTTIDKIFWIYDSLYVEEFYGGKLVETIEATEISRKLKAAIPRYEYE